MAYRIQRRKQTANDTLELVSADGKICDTIEWSINLEELLAELPQIQERIKDAQKRDDAEGIGRATVDLLTVIFGYENTKRILKFYEDKYFELLEDLTPYIVGVVYPKINEYSHEKTERMKQLRAQVRGRK